MDLAAMPWTQIWEEAISSVVSGSVRHRMTLAGSPIFSTFRVVVPTFTSGTIAASLRFGFGDSDADAATQGIDFATLSAANASETQSPVWSFGASAPGFPGNSNSILPPRVSIIATTTGTVSLTYQIYAAYFYARG